jgi:hypothetical protein
MPDHHPHKFHEDGWRVQHRNGNLSITQDNFPGDGEVIAAILPHPGQTGFPSAHDIETAKFIATAPVRLEEARRKIADLTARLDTATSANRLLRSTNISLGEQLKEAKKRVAELARIAATHHMTYIAGVNFDA